ncbi:uncharacterized protein VTP21DRAFT_4173 [Calcarisporiella thermophila]|uniref:uncharacterized protein n=1 Tax=Calcarisporiella thermophila TaxID=911321 RepID=UPI00374231A1
MSKLKSSADFKSVLADLDDWRKSIRAKDQYTSSATKSNVEAVSAKSASKIENVKSEGSTERNEKRSIVEKEKGNEFFKNGKFEDAIQCYTTSIAFDPKNAVSLINRAMAYLKLKRYKEAEKDCTVGLGLQPDNVKALWRRGIALKEQGKYKEARQDFQRALDIEPGNKQVFAELSKLPTEVAPDELLKPMASKKMVSPSQQGKSLEPEAMVDRPERRRLVIEEVDTFEAKKDEKKSGEVLVAPLKTSSSVQSAITHSTGIKLPEVNAEVKTQAPRTTYEFERDWRTYRRNEKLLYQYLKCIPPSSFGNLFRSSFESEYLTKFIEVLKNYYIPNDSATEIYNVLKGLSQVQRFEMVTMFLSSSEKQALLQIFDHIQSGEEVSAEDLEKLKKKWGC